MIYDPVQFFCIFFTLYLFCPPFWKHKKWELAVSTLPFYYTYAFFRVFLVISFVDTTKYGTFHTYPNDQSLGLIMDNFQIQNTTQNGVLKPWWSLLITQAPLSNIKSHDGVFLNFKKVLPVCNPDSDCWKDKKLF